MATDANNIPQGLLRTLVEGFPRERESMADSFCDYRAVEDESSTIPVEPVDFKLPIDKSSGEHGIPPGAEHGVQDDDMTEVSYNVLRYGDSTFVKDSTVEALDSKTGKDTLARTLGNLRTSSSRKIDARLHDALTDTTDLNTSQSVGTAWTDGANSTPFEDIDDALDNVPGADSVFVGRDAQKALKVHPDFLAESSNFSAGSLNQTQVAEVLANKYENFQNIMVNDTHYSKSDDPDTLGLTYDLAGVFWIGYQSDIIMVEQTSVSPKTSQGREVRRGGLTMVYERYIDILRPHQEMGRSFTGHV